MANLSFAFWSFQAFFFLNSQLIEFADTELVDTVICTKNFLKIPPKMVRTNK